jgi:hypothetical protein
MHNINNSGFYFIFETANFNTDYKVVKESVSDSGEPKVIVKAIFQEAEEKNKNKRWYSKDICQHISNHLDTKAKSRSLLMEVDHPMFVSDDSAVLKRRAKIIEFKTAGALLRKLKFDNKYIIGEFETLTSYLGPQVYKSIVYDKINIGFSLRALGKLVPDPANQRIIVSLPMEPITYDIVTNPSHVNARILEFLPESEDLSLEQSLGQLVYESEDVELLKKDNILICENGSCYYTPFAESIISDVFKELVNKIRFKLNK